MRRPTDLLLVYANRRMAVLAALGFASGLPLALTAGTLQAWLTDQKISIEAIALFSLVWVPYAFKFCWSPLMDRYAPPLLGRRRGWLLITQLLLIVAIGGMAVLGPVRGGLSVFALASLLVAFFSASQDIVADAYRTDLLSDPQRGAGAAVFVTGYRVGFLVSSAVTLVVADRWHVPWPTLYLAMAALMSIGVVATLLAPQPVPDAGAPPVTAPRTLREAVIEPLREFACRPDGWLIALFIVVFKLPEVCADVFKVPFLLQIGATKAQIGTIAQGIGLALSIVGALVGGAIVARWGLWRSLWLFALLGAVSNFGFWTLSETSLTYTRLAAVIGTENFCAGLVTAGFVAFLMSQCAPRYSATQYALLSSLMALTKVIAAPPGGVVIRHLGWTWFFGLSVVAAIPGMALLIWIHLPTAQSASSDRAAQADHPLSHRRSAAA